MSISPTDFATVAALARRRAAIVLSPGKEYLVEARLTPLARELGLPDLAALVDVVRRERERGRTSDRVVDALTTNETSWFRDRHPFDALGTDVVGELVRSGRPDRTIRIWSAACSTGQEPYSILMLLNDRLAAHPGWRVDMLATDISETALAQAREGRYGQLEMNRGLPAPLLVRNFTRSGPGWQVRPELRSQVTFRSQNLIEPFAPMQPLDVVMLRNVLIYFDTETKRRILANVRRVLRPGGLLFLGAAETTLNLDAAFRREQLGPATAYRTAPAATSTLAAS